MTYYIVLDPVSQDLTYMRLYTDEIEVSKEGVRCVAALIYTTVKGVTSGLNVALGYLTSFPWAIYARIYRKFKGLRALAEKYAPEYDVIFIPSLEACITYQDKLLDLAVGLCSIEYSEEKDSIIVKSLFGEELVKRDLKGFLRGEEVFKKAFMRLLDRYYAVFFDFYDSVAETLNRTIEIMRQGLDRIKGVPEIVEYVLSKYNVDAEKIIKYIIREAKFEATRSEMAKQIEKLKEMMKELSIKYAEIKKLHEEAERAVKELKAKGLTA